MFEYFFIKALMNVYCGLLKFLKTSYFKTRTIGTYLNIEDSYE